MAQANKKGAVTMTAPEYKKANPKLFKKVEPKKVVKSTKKEEE